MLQINTLFLDIRSGKYDHMLEDLRQEIAARKEKLVPRVVLTKYRSGDRVEFNSKVRPQYLQGKTAVVVKVNRTRVKIRLEHPEQLLSDRFTRGTGLINCPTSLLIKI